MKEITPEPTVNQMNLSAFFFMHILLF